MQKIRKYKWKGEFARTKVKLPLRVIIPVLFNKGITLIFKNPTLVWKENAENDN